MQPINYSRFTYFILICVTIILGLLSRYFTFVPLWVGDVLWATMVFYMVGFVAIDDHIKWIILISLLFCYAIEVSQFYHSAWIDQLRQTLFGKLVLGSVFEWGDLLSYTAGVFIGGATVTKKEFSDHLNS